MSEKFRTIFDRICVISNPGTDFRNDYAISYDDDGKRILKKSGVINVYNEIQAAREYCDLNILLDKYINCGDETILNKKPTFYGDVSEIPTNYAEILRLGAEANRIFDSLSVEQREMFDNSADVFFASIGSEKFNSVFGEKENVKEVNANEQKSE